MDLVGDIDQVLLIDRFRRLNFSDRRAESRRFAHRFWRRTRERHPVWELDPEVWVDAACRVAGRNLTTDEWQADIGEIAEYHALCPESPADY